MPNNVNLDDPFAGYEKKDPRRKTKSIVAVLIVVLLVAIAGGVYVFLLEYLPSGEEAEYREFLGLSPESIGLVLDDRRIDNYFPCYENDAVYLPTDFIKNEINQYIFWDKASADLIITINDSVMRFKPNMTNYRVDNEPQTLRLPLIESSNEAYLPADLLMSIYNISISYDAEANIVIVDSLDISRQICQISSKEKTVPVRFDPDKKSPIMFKLTGEDKFVMFDEPDGREYQQVRLSNGYFGYILSSEVTLVEKIAAKTEPLPDYSPTKQVEGKINMVWDQVTNFAANLNSIAMANSNDINVISPTWFEFDKDSLNGDIKSLADRRYVDWAHSRGIKVWALITDNFSSVVSHAVLSDTAVREHVIDQLLNFVDSYSLDGINIDFENVKAADADYYIQFLRELYPPLKRKQVVLSVDMYVPMNFNMYYNRTEIGRASDYLIIMGYDEHHSTSEVSGPVASIGFVRDGVANTLKEVGNDKVILGMPYYVRVWREEPGEDGQVTVTSAAYGMSLAYSNFRSRGANFTWDDEMGCNYAEYTATENRKQITYKVWLEDEKSIEEKLKVASEFNLAGVSGWKRGLEKEAIWKLLDSYMAE